jgi:hypothetical protein
MRDQDELRVFVTVWMKTESVLVLGASVVRRGRSGGRHHLVVNHVVLLEKVIYSSAIAVQCCSAEFRCAETTVYKYLCDECWDIGHLYISRIVVVHSFQGT